MDYGETLPPRVIRHVSEHRKLLTKADQIALIHPSVHRHAVDYAAAESIGKAGFLPHDLACIQLWTTRCITFTLILIPLRLYYRPLWRRRAFELKAYLQATGKRCILAPASYLDRQPRLQNARLIAASRCERMSASDRITIMARIDEAVHLSLEDASSLSHAKDPTAAVLNLIAERALQIDTDKIIGPHSLLSMRTGS